MFEGFSDNTFKTTIGVTLSDYRSSDGQLDGDNIIKYKDGREHNIIIGNIFDRNIYKKINNITNGQKINLILERMVAGFRNVPNSPMIIIAVLQKWYSMLDEGGILLVETPIFLEDVIVEWIRVLRRSYHKVLDVKFDPGQGALRIRKLSGAPAKLPVLGINVVKKILNNDVEIDL